jgi:replicative DNA helicase
MSVIGAILQDHHAFLTARAIVTPDDFFQHRHRLIFDAALSVADDRGETVDLVSVTAELRRAGTLDDAGSSAYLTELLAAIPTTAAVKRHACVVKQMARARRTCDLALRLYRAALKDDGWRDALLDLVSEAPVLAASPDDAPLHRRSFVTTPL